MEESTIEVVHVTVLDVAIVQGIFMHGDLQALRVGQCVEPVLAVRGERMSGCDVREYEVEAMHIDVPNIAIVTSVLVHRDCRHLGRSAC